MRTLLSAKHTFGIAVSPLWRAVCVKILSEDYGSGTNQMGGFVGGAPFCKWPILGLGGFFIFIFVFQELRIKSKISLGTVASSLLI